MSSSSATWQYVARGAINDYGLRIAILAVVWAYFLVTTPAFRVGGLAVTMDGFALLGLVCLGLGVTMIAGELDLSSAPVAAYSGIVAVQLAEEVGLWPALLLVAIFAAGFGAFQGWLIGALGISSLVLTLGALIWLRGLAYVVTDGSPVLLTDFSIADVLLKRVGPFTASTFVALGAFVLVALFLRYVRLGREIYAIGGSRREAMSSGVPLRRTLSISFAISASCAALAGALASLRGGSGSWNAFPDLLLLAAAAALVGGISIAGGRGTVWHIALGVAIVSVVQVGLVARRAPNYEAQAIIGSVLLLIVALELIGTRSVSRQKIKRYRRNLDSASGA